MGARLEKRFEWNRHDAAPYNLFHYTDGISSKRLTLGNFFLYT